MTPTLRMVFGFALVLCSFAMMSSAALSNGTVKARQGPASSQPSVLPVKTGTQSAASPRPVVAPIKTGTGAQSVVVPAGAGAVNNQARPRPVRSALNSTLSVHREADKSTESDEVKDSDEAPAPKEQRPTNPLFRPLHFQPAAAVQQGADSSDDSVVPAPSQGVRSPSATNRTLPVTAAASANNGTGSGHKFLGFTF